VARASLVVIGTKTSHACHVLDDECLDDPEIARAIAARFELVKIDADARPDLDARLQPGAMPVWPLVCVLDGEGRLVRRAAHLTRAGFVRFLDGDDAEVREEERPRVDGGDSDITIISAQIRRTAPPRHPHAPALELLLSREETRGVALRVLDGMALGGIRDQLDGGFHRYATDDRWVVPHFEKRAQDQAAVLSAYLRAFRVTREARWAEVARGIAGHVERRLAIAAGGFACGEDCDVGAYDDGTHFTWTAEEARAALDEREWRAAERAFDIYGRGELDRDPTRNVLFVAASPAELARELRLSEPDAIALLDGARRKLLAARDQRPRPAVDGAVYTDVSAALARALAEAGELLDLAGARESAERTLARAERAMIDGRVPHRLDAPPADAPLFFLADHAQLGLLALALGRADFARALADRILADFSDESSAFLDRPREMGAPLVPIRDAALPSGNALAGALLAAIGRALADEKYLDRARSLVAALRPRFAGAGIPSAGLVTLAAGLP